MEVYSGIDLHSNSNYVGILDSNGKRIFHEKLPNDITVVKDVLAPFGAAMQGVVVESTYNCRKQGDAYNRKQGDAYKIIRIFGVGAT